MTWRRTTRSPLTLSEEPEQQASDCCGYLCEMFDLHAGLFWFSCRRVFSTFLPRPPLSRIIVPRIPLWWCHGRQPEPAKSVLQLHG